MKEVNPDVSQGKLGAYEGIGSTIAAAGTSEAKVFWDSVNEINQWADGRL